MNFLDTNILLYSISEAPEERRKKSIAIDLLRRVDTCISAQVLAEFYHNATRKIETTMSRENVQDWLSALNMPCLAVDAELVRDGARLSEQHRISYWDGAILAAAERMGCDTVYSEDLNAGQRYGSVSVTNPFMEAA